MSSLVIVAIPEDDSPVWRLSSEKVPHMTMLFLGEDVSDEAAARIAQFLQHMSDSSLTKFTMEIDYRGTLGEEDADVFFFSKSEHAWGYEKAASARQTMLQQKDIQVAYNAADQYPEWTPHLTLGYPETPANEIEEPDERHIYGVMFDRIALWTGDYDGPEFRLKSEYDTSLLMSENVEDFLEHYGIKGMKWGIRRSRAELGYGPPGEKKGGVLSRLRRKKSSGGGSVGSGKSSETKSDERKASEDISEDAMNFIKASQKPPNALSNQEIQILLTRANLNKQYDSMFNTSRNDPNAQLRQKVERLRLENDMRKIQAEMNAKPDIHQKMQKRFKTASAGFTAYKKLDEATGGSMNKQLAKAWKDVMKSGAVGKHRK